MLGTILNVDAYMVRFGELLQELDSNQLVEMSEDIHRCYENAKTVFICGNGGSGSNSSHFCEDLGKSSLDPSDFENENVKRLKVMSLTDNTPYILAWANDEGFDRIFVEQLKNFAQPGDCLIAISGSGNSENVLKAVDWANQHQLSTWGVTGYTGGKLSKLAQHQFHVPLDDMGMVESVHMLAFHWVLNDLFARINRVGRFEKNTNPQTLPLRKAA